tara:strand:+ start:75 stop:338 length:264 start_codon:yes stop_codon:yes gene_type:complete
MGFHKRWITEEILIERYRREGIAGIESYLGHADAFVTSDNLSADVVDLFNIYDMDNIKKWNNISRLISDASIEKGFGEKEKKTIITG